MSIDVVIPARDAATLIGECVDAAVAQLRDGDVLTVVDDGSVDGTAEIAERHGAHVVRLDSPHGPYAARQRAGMVSDADVLVFLDARCRVRDGWLESHRSAMHSDDAALSCSEVVVVAGRSLASHVAARQQPFRIRATVPEGGGLPYYPACNLGVRTSAFKAVGGFADIRSGGDADLCWRIQRAGLGRLVIDDRRLVHWIPRDSLRALAEQWSRYGTARAALDHSMRTSASPEYRLFPRASLRAVRLESLAVVHDPKSALVAGVSVLMYGLQWWSYAREMRRRVRQSRR